MKATVVEEMGALGFTASEAKAYAALLKIQPATGYELAAESGVPRSAIYNVLKRLKAEGLVNAVQAKPTKYVALAPDQLVALLEQRFAGRLKVLGDALEKLAHPTEAALLWQIQGYRAILDAAREMVGSAERFIAASLWAREADVLGDALREAAGAGASVILFSLTELPPDLGAMGTTFSYGIPERELEPHWHHKIILIADGGRALAGSTEVGESTRAILTEDPTIVEMAANNLILDITLFGSREGVETGGAVARLQDHLAPIDELLAERGARDGASSTPESPEEPPKV